MNQIFTAGRRILGNRYGLGGLAIASLGLLNMLGWLLPLLRFAILVALVIAVTATVFAVYRLITATLSQNEDPSQPTVPKLKTASITSGISVLVCSVALALLPTGDHPAELRENHAGMQDSAISTSNPSTLDAISQVGETVPEVDAVEPRQDTAQTDLRNAQSTASRSDEVEAQASRDAMGFFGTLLQAQIEANQRAQNDPRYLEFQQSIQQLSLCPRCGGQGNYRYVDNSGTLQVQRCPSCLGSGKAY